MLGVRYIQHPCSHYSFFHPKHFETYLINKENMLFNLRDGGHTRQLIVHILQWTRYSFLVRMLFENIQVQAVIYFVQLLISILLFFAFFYSSIVTVYVCHVEFNKLTYLLT